MEKCLKTLAIKRKLNPFDTDGVTSAASVYTTRGKSEDEANQQAVQDHLDELMADRDKIIAEVIDKYKAERPDAYAKLEKSLTVYPCLLYTSRCV